MELDNIETIKRVVEVGAGVAIVPEPTIAQEVKNRTLVRARSSPTRRCAVRSGSCTAKASTSRPPSSASSPSCADAARRRASRRRLSRHVANPKRPLPSRGAGPDARSAAGSRPLLKSIASLEHARDDIPGEAAPTRLRACTRSRPARTAASALPKRWRRVQAWRLIRQAAPTLHRWRAAAPSRARIGRPPTACIRSAVGQT